MALSKLRNQSSFRGYTALFAFAAALLVFKSSAAQALYENPVLPGDHPDPSIIRVGHDFWATSTSSEWGPQFPLLHSKDLVNWDMVGSVFPHRPAWAVANFWAPEIAEFKGRFFVYYVGRKADGPLAVAVAAAENPAGPYVDHGPLVAQEAGSIDPVPVTAEDGSRYLVWKEDGNSRGQPTPIWAQRLSEDGIKLTGEPKELLRNDADWEGKLIEGPFVLRRANWYYLFYSGNGCCGPGCHYALGVARAHDLLGPWEKNPANPILAGNAAWKCPGHGSIVTDEAGRYWLLYHAYSASGTIFTGREGMLDEVKFGPDDWATINDGKGPSTSAPSPLGAAQRKADVRVFDNFQAAGLDAGWQWPQDREPNYRLQDGHLLLRSAGHSTDVLAAVLARATTAPDYVATAVVEARRLKPDCSVGLCAIGDADNAMGLALNDHGVFMWRKHHGAFRELVRREKPAGEKVQLRISAREGYEFQFSASSDGKHWSNIGQPMETRNLPPWDRSVRVALTVGGADGAEGCFGEFSMQAQARTQLR